MKKVLTNWVTYGVIVAGLIVWFVGSFVLAALVLSLSLMFATRTKPWKVAFLLLPAAVLVLTVSMPQSEYELIQQMKDDVGKVLPEMGMPEKEPASAVTFGKGEGVEDYSLLLKQHPEITDDVEQLLTWKQQRQLLEQTDTASKDLAYSKASRTDWEQVEFTPGSSTTKLLVLVNGEWKSSGIQFEATSSLWANYQLAKQISGMPESLLPLAQLQPDGTWMQGWVWNSAIQRLTTNQNAQVVEFQPFRTRSEDFGEWQIIDRYIATLRPGQVGHLEYLEPYWEPGEQEQFKRGYRFRCKSATLLVTLNGQQYTAPRGTDVISPPTNGQFSAIVAVSHDAQYPETVVEFLYFREPKQ